MGRKGVDGAARAKARQCRVKPGDDKKEHRGWLWSHSRRCFFPGLAPDVRVANWMAWEPNNINLAQPS